MNSTPKPHEIVQAFAQQQGIADLTLSPAGTAGIRLKEGVELYLEQGAANGKLFAYVTVGHLPPPERRLAYLEQMLVLNCLEQGTLCGTLAIDGLTDAVLLQTGIPQADLSVMRLQRAMEELLFHRQRIANSLRRCEDGAAERLEAAPPAAAQSSRLRALRGAA